MFLLFLWGPSACASESTSALLLIVLSTYWTFQLSPPVLAATPPDQRKLELSMNVCMYVSTYVRMYVCAHACYVRVYVCMMYMYLFVTYKEVGFIFDRKC
jgi:hypothetical protein